MEDSPNAHEQQFETAKAKESDGEVTLLFAIILTVSDQHMQTKSRSKIIALDTAAICTHIWPTPSKWKTFYQWKVLHITWMFWRVNQLHIIILSQISPLMVMENIICGSF